jgi:glycerol-3-phosphate dehydrogenase
MQDDPVAPPAVRGTKGVHIAVPRERLGNHGALTLLSPLDGRVMFALPAGAHSIIGTTDTPTAAAPDEVRATEDDVDYLLRSANVFFPGAGLSRSDVVSAWAGIRPLVASGYRANGGATSASREHEITVSARGVVTVSGGKLTTYRSMAAEAVDAAERALGGRPSRSRTAELPLPGGDIRSLDEELAAARTATGRDDVAERLVHAYGGRWRDVWALADADPALAAPLVGGLPYVAAELVHGVEREMACTLADLLVRRTFLAFETRDAAVSVAERAAALVAPLLGWSAAAERREVARYRREAERLFAVDAAEPVAPGGRRVEAAGCGGAG